MSVIESEIAPEPAPAPEDAPRHAPDGSRELIESIAVAFMLAFLFRTFVAEAFVIPTGSMAPTLMGRHKDVVCPECGVRYWVGASDEADARTGRPHPPENRHQVVGGVCPQCRFHAAFVDWVELPDGEERIDVRVPSYKGDRILVDKGAYHFQDPRRWDVVVFKCPGEAETNYIKRLVGLPNETVRIERGDLQIRPKGASEFDLARKPPAKVAALLQPVFDNDHLNSWMTERGWPARWRPDGAVAETAWKPIDGGRAFEVRSGAETAWLGYRHVPPRQRDWDALQAGPLPADYAVRPQLISDASAYNSNISAREPEEIPSSSFGYHWVGDLAVECELTLGPAPASNGRVTFCLVKAGRKFLCHLDPSTGAVQLEIEGLSNFAPLATIDALADSNRRVRFANVDRQLLVWVDDDLVEFAAPTAYPDLHDRRPTGDDLEPVRIGARSLDLTVSHLRVLRDNYYIAQKRGVSYDYLPHAAGFLGSDEALASLLSDESRWDVFETGMRHEDFTMDDDQFFMLGDNSASSLDGRLWDDEHFVSRPLLVGKALYVYWPHAWPTSMSFQVPGTEMQLPFIPQFGRMGWIR